MNQYRTERRARRFDRLAIRGMKTATYIVTAKSGKTYRWRFTEHRRNGDYGNGVYIAVKTPSGDIFSLDRRYAYNYDFRKACVDYLLVYYGDNLDELSEEDEGDEETPEDDYYFSDGMHW